jgi:DtxR family Mn-dependent transcriptional regulator
VTSLTVENYLKTIYHITVRAGEPASTGELAAALGVSPGTVTSMLKTLGESGLATYTPYEGVRLTAQGTTLALRITRRHRLIELFLVQTLRMTWDEVHEEAEHMEHAVSDLLVDRIDAFLAYPKVDPHGDPIPRADGTVDEAAGRQLTECRPHEKFRVVRVLDQAPDFLRFLSDSNLTIGAAGIVDTNRVESGALTLTVDGRSTTLGRDAAQKILVVSLGAAS